MDRRWHQEVGSAITFAMMLQCLTAGVAPLAPAVTHSLGKRKWRKQLTLVEMQNLWTGPEWDAPKCIGKAFAFFAVTVSYGAVLPLLYLVGLLYFGLTWLANRWAVLRLHATPPAFSYALIHSTLWWGEAAIFWHVGFGFWGYASLPSYSLSGDWSAPFSNATSEGLSLLSSTVGVNSTSLGFTDGYDIGGHVNSYGTLFLFLIALLVLIKVGIDVALGLLSSVVPVPSNAAAAWKELRRSLKKAAAKVAPAEGAPKMQEMDTEEVLADELEVDGDPDYSKALAGVRLPKVRTFEGGTVHESQVLHADSTVLEKLAYLNPTKSLFTLLGLVSTRRHLTPQQWETAAPVPARIEGEKNISYEPEFSPQYEKAYAYMAPTYVLDEAVTTQKKEKDAAAAASGEGEGEGEEESTEEEDACSESGSDADLTVEARYALERGRR